jgi:hypothetical protein
MASRLRTYGVSARSTAWHKVIALLVDQVSVIDPQRRSLLEVIDFVYYLYSSEPQSPLALRHHLNLGSSCISVNKLK